MFSPIRLSHILQFIPRAAFNAAVKQSQADRYAKKVSSWDLLVTLLLGQLTQARSLRSLAVTSQSLQPHRYHLNANSLSRSEPPREFRRLFGVSHAAWADSVSC